jgi:hypothetical protein
MSKKLMVALALNNIVLGGALVLSNDRLMALGLVVSDHIVEVADTFTSFSNWSRGIVDGLNLLLMAAGQ